MSTSFSRTRSLRVVVRWLSWIGLFVACSTGAGWLLNHFGLFTAHQMPAHQETPQSKTAPTDSPKVLYWYDPMYPTQHFDKPGPSPFMDMDLVPKYAPSGQTDDATNNSTTSVQISPRLQQNLGVRIMTVQTKQVKQTDRVWTGQLSFDDRRLYRAQARDLGFVEKVHPYRVGDSVAADAPLAEIFIPSWFAAQQEFLTVLDMQDAGLTDAARQRLRLLGMRPAQIDQVARSRRVLATQTIRSPNAGVLSEFLVQAGMTVAQGQTLATVMDQQQVWLEILIPERDSSQIQVGDPVSVTIPALGQTARVVRIAEILPTVTENSRQIQARAALDNRNGLLKAGMTAQVRYQPTSHLGLWVEDQAIIRTGTRVVVIVQQTDGSFSTRSVSLGQSAGDQTEITSGLTVGERLVVSGQFLIDSEANLQGVLDQMNSLEIKNKPVSDEQMSHQHMEAE